MKDKDFSIFLETATTTNNTKDFAVVSGFNSIVQQIEHVAKTHQNELISDMKFGSKFYDYIYSGNLDRSLINLSFSSAVQAALPSLSNVKVNMSYYSDNLIKFDVYFSLYDGIKKQENIYCNIEVPL